MGLGFVLAIFAWPRYHVQVFHNLHHPCKYEKFQFLQTNSKKMQINRINIFMTKSREVVIKY